MGEEKTDSLERLLEDLDRAARVAPNGNDGEVSDAYFIGVSTEDALSDAGDIALSVSKRLHALMPHDAEGREIRVGDELVGLMDDRDAPRRYVVDGLRVVPMRRGGVISADTAEEVRVVPPDSWERLERDAKLTPRDYLGGHGLAANECGRVSTMAADIVRRAKALAGVSDD